MVGDTRSKVGRQDDSTTVVFLSLYLILLAFFILLTSISYRDSRRVEVAMGSVTSTFGALIPEKTVPGTRGTEGRFEQAPRAFINLIRKVFQENLPAVKAPAIAASGIMRLQVPILDLFSRGDDRIRPRSRPLLGGIADGLALQNDEWRFEVEVVLGTGAALPSGSSVGANLEVRRAGAFARYLRAIGVPAHSVRTGLRAGDREVVQLSFYIRDVKQARLNLQVNGQ